MGTLCSALSPPTCIQTAVKYATFDDDTVSFVEELTWHDVHATFSSCGESALGDFHPENCGYQVVRVTLGMR